MASPKTTAVQFKDGTDGRGIKLTRNNVVTTAKWAGAKIEVITKKDKNEDYKLSLFKNGSRQKLVARVGDTIVKTKAGFTVVKAENFAKYIKI